MSVEGVDYAWDRPSVSGLVAAGKKFVVRYGGPGSDGKQIDAAELRALTAAGISVVANAEGTAKGFMGRDAGRSWAIQARDHFEALGMPSNRPIYFSADWEVASSQYDDVDAALRGAAEIIGAGRVGLYGGRRIIEHAKSAGTARWLWQTYAWSYGVWVPGVHIQQYRNGVPLAGGTVDLCRALVADYGQWGTVNTPTGGVTELFCSKGDKGLAVRALQVRLKNLGYLDNSDVDGVYGDGTQAALRKACVAASPTTGADGSAFDHYTTWYVNRLEHTRWNAEDAQTLASKVSQVAGSVATLGNAVTELDGRVDAVESAEAQPATGGLNLPASVTFTGTLTQTPQA